MEDSLFTRHIRPVVLLIMTLAYITGFFFKYDLEALNPVMLLMYGFYFTSRGVEKVLNK